MQSKPYLVIRATITAIFLVLVPATTVSAQNTELSLQNISIRHTASRMLDWALPRSSLITRVSIIQNDANIAHALLIAALLQENSTDFLDSVGTKLELTNISAETQAYYQRQTIYYYQGRLKEALYLAKVLPGEQNIQPMRYFADYKIGSDIIVIL